MAPRQELDTDVLYWHHDHTETLVQAGVFLLVQLWDKYGLVGQLVVSISSYVLIIIECFTWPFMNNFPRANIYELISPDLLHRIIKGVFKDHLVDWVENYIRFTYDAEADAILDDIDQRYAVPIVFHAKSPMYPQDRCCCSLFWTEVFSTGLSLQAVDGQ